MRIEITPGVRLFVDVDGFGLVPEGPALREKPTLLLLHGGPGFDHSGFKPAFSQLADGRWVKGFICETRGLAGATDITAHGGWRAYLRTVAVPSA